VFYARVQADLITGSHLNGLEAGRPIYPVAASPNISGAHALVTDEHYKHSLGIVRHLGRQGVFVSVVAGSKQSLACRSRYCREVLIAEDGQLETLVLTILKTVRQQHFDLIIPVSYAMTLALAQRKDELLPHTQLEVAPGPSIAMAADKLEMIDLAQRLGVPAPRTVRSSEALASGLRFPVVIKPQRESPGRPPIRYARNPQELRCVLEGPSDPVRRGFFSNLIVQEYVPGHGCGLFATYQKGVCKRVFMHRRVREYPASGGVSSCADSFYDSKLANYGRRLLDELNWHGVAMVEFRRDSRDGEYKLMEINPKFWGSLDLALAAGADFPGDLCKMALGQTLTFSDHYQRNLRFHWPFSGQGELFHLWTRPQSFFAVALDYLNPRVKSNVWLTDPKPNMDELGKLFGRTFQRRKV
jgi:predicted ATP-grasp superfamily ATP-dependent carboligase